MHINVMAKNIDELMNELFSKEVWNRDDWEDVVQRFHERWLEKNEEDLEPIANSRLASTYVANKADLAFFKKVREAQERQRKDKANKGGNPVSTETDDNYKVPNEIDNDPYTRNLFMKALEEGSITDRCIRINVVGNFSQGKTSLIRRLVGQTIEGVETTNGIDIDRYSCKESQDGNLYCIKCDINDMSDTMNRLCNVASSDELKRATPSFGHRTETDDTQKAQKDTGNQSSKSSIDFEADDDSVAFCNNLISKRMHEALKTEGDKSATFDIWDFGGQYVYCATHTMFHSRLAIYLLVGNLSLEMEDIIADDEFPAETGDRNVAYFIRFWMNSIHSFVGTPNGSEPLVILVGTHKDKLHGDEEEKDYQVQNYFENVRELFDNTDVLNHIHSRDFAVSNVLSTDSGIESLRKEIINIGKEKATVFHQIPAKWIPLENALLKRRNENILLFAEVKQMDAGNVYSLGDEEQIKLFLLYHHSKGTIFYSDEEPVSEYVVINPQYLIDAFKCIVTSERFFKKEPKIRPLWRQLVREAKLENDLIDFQWQRNEDKNFMVNKQILLSFLKKHHIISEVMKFDEQCQSAEGLGWYIVPSLLKTRITQTNINDFLQGKKQTLIRVVLMFENSAVVPILCHRLFAAALGKWCVASFDRHLLLFEDYAVLRLDMYNAGIITMNMKEKTIELQVVGLGCSPYMGDNFRRFAETLLKHEFGKYKPNESVEPYLLSYRCSHSNHGTDGSKLAELSHMDGKRKVPCPNLDNHNITVTKAKSEWFLESNVIISEIPKKIPSDKELSKISLSIGEGWEMLGIKLGLTKVQIDHLNEDNRIAAMKRFGMLTAWRNKMAGKATMYALVKAITKVPKVRIDWDIIRNTIDGITM